MKPWGNRAPEIANSLNPAFLGAVLQAFVLGHGQDYDYGGERIWALNWKTGRRLWTEHISEDFEISGCFCASEDVVVYCIEKKSHEIVEARIIARHLDSGKKMSFQVICRIDTPVEVDYYRNGGILQTVLRKLLDD